MTTEMEYSIIVGIFLIFLDMKLVWMLLGEKQYFWCCMKIEELSLFTSYIVWWLIERSIFDISTCIMEVNTEERKSVSPYFVTVIKIKYFVFVLVFLVHTRFSSQRTGLHVKQTSWLFRMWRIIGHFVWSCPRRQLESVSGLKFWSLYSSLYFPVR